jgi:hypothetical protein
MSKPNIHVVHKQGNWAVEEEGVSNLLDKFLTKAEAVTAGKLLAKEHAVELLIHREDGSIDERL